MIISSLISNVLGQTGKRIFVSPSGSDGNPGTNNSPFKSISYAIKQAVPNDTVILKQGTYAERILIGLNKRPLTIASEFVINSDTSTISGTILDAKNLPSVPLIVDSTYLSAQPGNSYLSFIGFTIKNNNSCIVENGRRIILKNMQVTDAVPNTNTFGWIFPNISYSIVLNSKFLNNGKQFSSPNLGIFSLGAACQILNSEFKGNMLNGPIIYTQTFNFPDTIKISGNLFRYNSSQSPFATEGNTSSNMIRLANSHVVYFGNNLIDNNYGYINIENYNIDGQVIFYNNTIVDNIITNDANFINLYGSSKNKNYLFNNIIQFNTGFKGVIKKQVGIKPFPPNGYPSLEMYNNYIGHDSITSQIENVNGLLDAFINSNNRSFPIVFSNPKNLDYSLSNTSNGIGQGVNAKFLLDNSNDFFGKSRPWPKGSNPDVGAIENLNAYSAPQLQSAEGGDKRIRLFWSNEKMPGQVRFKIYRSTSPIPDTAATGLLTDTVNINSLSYSDTSSLVNLTRYYYRMKVVDTAGLESALSNELSLRPNVQPPTVSNLRAESGPASILLNWKPVSNAGIKYTIYRSTDSISSRATIIKSSLLDSSYLDTTATKAIPRYYYWVKSVDSVGATSEFSSYISSKVIPIWYVSPEGSDLNIGSFYLPLKSLTKALSKVIAGDTIELRPGNYSGSSLSFNTSVLVRSERGADQTTVSSSDWAIFFKNDSIRIQGVTFKSSVYIENGLSPKFNNCIFKDISTTVIPFSGNAEFSNCIFFNNGSIFGINAYGPNLNFINCTFHKNSSFIQPGGGFLQPLFMNCIITLTGAASGYSDTSKKSSLPKGLLIIHSIVDDTVYSKIHSNSSLRTSFVNEESGDFHLKISSSGIGMGLKNYVYNNRIYNAPILDFDGKPRPDPVGSRPDVGAFENPKSGPVPFLGLIQRINDTTLVEWDYFDKSRVSRIILYRDTTLVLDTSKAFKKTISFNPSVRFFRDTLPSGSSKKYYYAIQLILKDTSITNLSNIQAANGIVKTNSFIPPMVNARYAWGDIDSDGDMDLAVMGNANEIFLQIYKNNNGTFSELLDRNSAPQVYRGTVKFADVDNDGDIDLFVSGQKTTNTTNIGSFLFKNNGTGNFTSAELVSIIPTREGDAAFGDHDNDGDLDLALSGIDATGKSICKLYNNTGNGVFNQEMRFFNFTSGPTNISYADIAWVDYDNDGDQDLIYTGVTNQIYGGVVRNTLINDSLTSAQGNTVLFNDFSVKDANFDLADLNGDGNVDIVLSGTGGTKIIYNQNIRSISSNLSNISLFIDSTSGKVKLADYDNDGDIDILFAGTDQLANPRTIFYINSGDGRNFMKKTYEIIPNLDMAGFSWADYDNDKDLDLVISGQKPTSQGGNVISEIYSFETEKKNLAPDKPRNVSLQDFGDGRILVKWDPSVDDLNPTGTLNYLVKIGTVSLGGNVGRPFTVVESNINGGNLLNPEAVLVYSNRYFTQLDPGKYYVLVQAVDNNKLTSVFSDTLFLTLTYPWKIVNQGGIVDATIGGNTNYSAKWGDIDRDNDYDFIYGGTLFESNRLNYKPALYQNDAASLLNSMINPNLKWHDLNQDGIPDMIISSSETINPQNANSSRFNLNIFLNDTSVTALDPITKQVTGKGRLTKANISPEDSIYLGNSRFKVSDINNDGKPDIMFAGLNKSSESRVHIFSTGPLPTDTSNAIKFRFNRLRTNLDSILLSQQSANLLFDFGDVDADNDNDFVAIYKNSVGKNLAKVFLNDGFDSVSQRIIFKETSRFNFEPLDFATLDLIDFDKDGDLDLITSGRSFVNGKQFLVYESRDTSFVKVPSNIGAFENGKLTFGDLNNDGFADLIYSGTREGSGYISKVALYDTDKKIFDEQLQFSFGDYQNLTIEFGDFDADNDLDILLYGRERSSNKDLFRVYKNVQNESAAVFKAIKPGGKANLFRSNEIMIESRMNNLNVNELSSTALGSNKVLADPFSENNPPSTPKNIKESVVRKIQLRTRVRFSWDASVDDNTPAKGLTYELRVGTRPGSSDVVVSSSSQNGYKLTPEEGNAGRNLSWDIDLPAGKYYWSVQAVDASLSGSVFSAERQFTVTSAGGICSVDIPTLSIMQNNNAICPGDTALLKSSIASGIQWYKDNVLITGNTDSILKVTQPGSYKVAKSVSGCAAENSNVVVISQKSAPSSGNISVSSSVPCTGGSIQLNSSSDSVIAWYKDDVLISGVSGKTFTATQSGAYSIVSKGSNGCLSSRSSIFDLRFKPYPTALTTVSTKSICEGAKTNLTAQSGTNYTYQWSRNGTDIAGATSATYAAGDSGIYKVKVSLDGCSSVSAGDTLRVFPVPSKPTISRNSTDLVSSGSSGNQWYLDGSAVAGATGQNFKPSASGNYTVRVKLNGCESLVSESYYFLITSILNFDNGQFIKFYPNPVDHNGILVIERKLNDEGRGLNVKVLDALGREVINKEMKRSESAINIPGASGTYFVQLKWGNGSSRLIKIFKR